MNFSFDPIVEVKLIEWAGSNDSIKSLWLFGSRAKGTAREDSDFDFAIELMPKKGNHDWAFGNYTFLYDRWKRELREIVNQDVSLVGFREDLEGPFDPRVEGFNLWTK